MNLDPACDAGPAMRVHAGFNLSCNRGAGSIRIGSGFHARRWCSLLVEGGSLSIGRNLFMNNRCSINCHKSVEIGDDCLFGEGVCLYDHDHVFSLPGSVRESGFKTGEIKVGNNVWLGTNVVVLRGSVIGDNSVVGANTVVQGLIPANSIVTAADRGTPAIRPIVRVDPERARADGNSSQGIPD
jgi:acetyltransferase-like isoleucine patch superfamily enzyme